MWKGLLRPKLTVMDTGNPVIDAQSAFARERRRRRVRRVAGWLLRRPQEHLVSLDCVLGSQPPRRRTVGMRTIPLDSIVGTAEASKERAFDAEFRPSGIGRDRWERIWVANHAGQPLPPISVFKVGDQHYVEDGHHRVSVAHSLGMAA